MCPPTSLAEVFPGGRFWSAGECRRRWRAIMLGPGIVLLAFTVLGENFPAKQKYGHRSSKLLIWSGLPRFSLWYSSFFFLARFLSARFTGGESIAARGNLLE